MTWHSALLTFCRSFFFTNGGNDIAAGSCHAIFVLAKEIAEMQLLFFLHNKNDICFRFLEITFDYHPRFLLIDLLQNKTYIHDVIIYTCSANMRVRMCMSVFTHIHIHMQCQHECKYVYVDIYTYIHTHAVPMCVYVCVRGYLHVYPHTHAVPICVYACVCRYLHVYPNAYACVCVLKHSWLRKYTASQQKKSIVNS